MAEYRPISASAFASKRWRRISSYRFAAFMSRADLVVSELTQACTVFPVAFVQLDGRFAAVGLTGLDSAKNLFVAPDGRWIGSYIPAKYRRYPFALAKVETDRYALCVDMDSGLIGEGFDLPFFEPNGDLAKPVKDVLNFLQQLEQNRELTIRLCAALDAEGLIVPWEVTVRGKDGEKKITDLYRIDEARLNSLDAAALYRLHQAGALPVAYCQLLSMQHIHTLGKLADAHAKIEAAQPQPEKPNGQSGVSFLGDDGKIDFSGFN